MTDQGHSPTPEPEHRLWQRRDSIDLVVLIGGVLIGAKNANIQTEVGGFAVAAIALIDIATRSI